MAGSTARRLGARAAGGAAAVAALMALAGPAHAEQPFDVPDQLTDRAGVLGGDVETLRAELEQLRSEQGVQLFFVYVDDFEGAPGDEWAQQTFEMSGMGGDDVLVAVSVDERRYGTWTTSESGISPGEDSQVRSSYIEPPLGSNDWSSAVRGAAEGYGLAASGDVSSSSPGSGGSGFPWGVLLLPIGGLVLFSFLRRASSRRSSGRTDQAGQHPAQHPAQAAPPPVPTEELRNQSVAALVDVDDAIRSSSEELSFAEAQFGVQATRGFKAAHEDARAKSAEAFRLQREL